MQNTIAQASCACVGCSALILGNLWAFQVLTVLLLVAVVLDFYHIWRRCRERTERMNAILAKRRPLQPKEECSHGSYPSC